MKLLLTQLGKVISETISDNYKEGKLQQVPCLTKLDDLELPDTAIFIDRDKLVDFTNDIGVKLDNIAEGQENETDKSTRDSKHN